MTLLMENYPKIEKLAIRPLLRADGFSIISAMVSGVILAVGILALVRLFPASVMIDSRADRISLAANFAEDKIEEFRAIEYTALQDTVLHGYTSGTDTSGHIIRHWTLTDTLGLIQANVRCSWKAPGVQDTLDFELITFISSHE